MNEEAAESLSHHHQLPPICKFFKKSGWCQFGDDCRFRHDSTPAPENFQRGRGGNRQRGRGRGGSQGGQRGNAGWNQQHPSAEDRLGRPNPGDFQQNDQESSYHQRHRHSGRGRHLGREAGEHQSQDFRLTDQRSQAYGDNQPTNHRDFRRQQKPQFGGNGESHEHQRGYVNRSKDEGTRQEQEFTRNHRNDQNYRHNRNDRYDAYDAQKSRHGENDSWHNDQGQNDRRTKGNSYNGGYHRRGRGRGDLGHHQTVRQEYSLENPRAVSTTPNFGARFNGDGNVLEQSTEVKSPTEESVTQPSTNQNDDPRVTEIRQLLRRFPKTISDDNGLDFELEFSSSDPDWPYDVKTIGLNIHLPIDYPTVSMEITLPEMSPANLPVPEVLRQYVEEEAQKWVKTRFSAMQDNGQTELAVRPFCRWLDRNMETIFTEGLLRTKREISNQASGFVFIRNEKDAEKEAAEEETEENGENDLGVEGDGVGNDEDDGVGDDEDGDAVEEQEDDEEWSDVEDIDEALDDLTVSDGKSKDPQNSGENQPSSSAGANCAKATVDAPLRKGTEMKLVNMELGENVALLRLVGLALVAQCAKCKAKTEVSLGPGKTQSKMCAKCRTAMTVQFRPSIAHIHSPVVGFLDIFGATPFDLITSNSKFSLECLGCNRGQAPSGLHAGKSGNGSFCSQCHARLHVAFSSVKFTALVANEAFVPKPALSARQEKKKAISLGIREGYPLPQSGACQHYKKSFRWFRFSCCGRVFPCDRCHEDEIKDHEPDFAPKMICGHCAKEQPFFKDKPCMSCGESTTRPRSSHWEGGKGCRNKIKMAATDKQKFRNCNKTMSKKAQEKLDATKPGNDKKETKLRHT